jgi:hypothetical protein
MEYEEGEPDIGLLSGWVCPKCGHAEIDYGDDEIDFGRDIKDTGVCDRL